MTALNFAKLYCVALILFLALDALWLGVVARGFYSSMLGHLMRPSPNWAAALVFYLLFIVGLVVLVVWPAVESGNLTQGLARAALFGLVTYAAYDLTNLATLEGFPLEVALLDMAWGAVVCASVGGLTILFSRWLLQAG